MNLLTVFYLFLIQTKMKKVAIWIMGMLAIVWWVTITSTLQSNGIARWAEVNVNEKVLDQIDTIFEQEKFTDKVFCEKALAKVEKAIDLTDSWSEKNLLFKYIEAKLKYQIKKVEKVAKVAPESKVTVVQKKEIKVTKKPGTQNTHSAAPENVRKIEQFRVTEPVAELQAEEAIEEQAETAKKWSFFHMPEYADEEENVWTSIKRISPPKKKKKSKKNFWGPEFKYEIDGNLHTQQCEQLECYNFCRNMDTNQIEEGDKKREVSVDQECRKTCISMECKKIMQRTKDKSRYLVEYESK